MHWTAHQVLPTDGRIIIDTEAHHGTSPFRLEGGFLLGIEISVTVVVARGLALGLLCFSHGLKFSLAGVAAVGQATIEQLLDCCAMVIHTLALNDGLFIPVEAKPLQTFEDVGREFRLGSFFVGVLDAQEELSPLMACKEPVENCRSCRADVKCACWTRGQPNAHLHNDSQD